MSKTDLRAILTVLIASVVSVGPSLAQSTVSARIAGASDQLRSKCRVQLRAQGVYRGWGGTTQEKHQTALFRQCILRGSP